MSDDSAQAWAKIRKAIEYYRPDLDPEVAVLNRVLIITITPRAPGGEGGGHG